MKKKLIQIYEVEPEEFKKEILEGVEKLLKEFSKQFTPKQPEIWMSRKDVGELLGISLVTIYDWGKKGILKPYKIGSRVRFRQSDIEKKLLQSNRRASQ
jgi:excisionase family DNA binding protein